MKVVKNTSHQNLSVCFTFPGGTQHTNIAPGQSTSIPDGWGGEILETLLKRRMVKVSHTPEPAPAPAPVVADKKSAPRRPTRVRTINNQEESK